MYVCVCQWQNMSDKYNYYTQYIGLYEVKYEFFVVHSPHYEIDQYLTES